jgi:hypothetical protein
VNWVRHADRTLCRWSPEEQQSAVRDFSRLSPRTACALVRHGYKSGQHVARTPDSLLMAVRNFGPKRLEEVRAVWPYQHDSPDPHPCPACNGTGVVPTVAYA